MPLRSIVSLLLVGAVASSFVACGDTLDIDGSGASFPRPLYEVWIAEYARSHPDVRLTYNGSGSSKGITDLTNGLTDFGASDSAMRDDELTRAREQRGRGVLMLPMTAGGICIVYNLKGIDELRLSRQVLAGIFLGDITAWNDSRIAADNSFVSLPDQSIEVVHRAEGSGTTFAFTNHLSAMSGEWRERVGPAAKDPKWPAGTGAPGNPGVAQRVQDTPGAIGYVELSFAKGMQSALLQNKAGKFVAPTKAGFQSSLATAELPSDLRVFLRDPEGLDAYPIVTYTWILAFESYPEDIGRGLKEFLLWCLTKGQEYSLRVGYVPLPEKVSSRVIEAVESIVLEPLPQ